MAERPGAKRQERKQVFVKIDLAPHPPVVTLEDPDNTKEFHVSVVNGTADGSSWGLVFGAMVDAAAGRLEGEDAYVTVDALRRMAKGHVAGTWDEDFEQMLAYAKTKGWLDEPGNAIRAHIEWGSR